MVGTTSYFLIDSLKALDKENLLTMLNGRIIGSEHMLGNELLTNTELWTKLNGIKGVQLKNLNSFASSGKTLAKLFQSKFTINSDVHRMVLSAEAMDLTLEALQNVGNNAEAIKDYFTAFNPEKKKSGYFGDYYFNKERTVEGLDFLVYELQDGELIIVE